MNMPKITKAIVPAAGLGTRMRPFTKAVPKEMLPLGRKPVLAYIIEELQAGGIEEILIVTRSDKPGIRTFFSNWNGIYFADEDEARGLGYAVWLGKEFVGVKDFVIAMADAPIWEEIPGILVSALCEIHRIYISYITTGMYQIPWEETHMRGILDPLGEIVPGKAVKLRNIIEKPVRGQAPSNWAGVGRYVFHPDILDILEKQIADAKGEIGITEAIQYVVNDGKPFYGLPLTENQRRFDTGNFEGYEKAFRFYSQKIRDREV